MDENIESTGSKEKEIPWKQQSRVLSRLLIGIAALVVGVVWSFIEQKSESRWVVWGFFPVPWFLVIAGAFAFLGEIIKKPAKEISNNSMNDTK
jgi:hypothetical protein